MNKVAVTHQIESNYCFPISKNEVVVRVRFDKADTIDEVVCLYGCKYEFYDKQNELVMTHWVDDLNYSYYECRLELFDVRLAYIFRIKSEGTTYYLSSDGVTTSYNFKTSYYNFFQIAYINEADILHEVSWAKDAVIYEIFIDRFNKGKNDRDQDYINLKWGDVPNPKSFAGGNLEGIIEKLDYLCDLGINCLYLTPVFKSISNHKYDISNYYEISEHFGDLGVLKRLIDECHKRGMRLILDAVFNHISSLSMQFQDVVEKGRNSEYFDWFIINGDKVSTFPLNYEVFSICDYMPKLNTSNPRVVEYLCGVGEYYIRELGIDGWRLDVSDEVSHDFWRIFRRRLKNCGKEVLLIGENWQDGSSYLMGDQFDGIMNYTFSRLVNEFLAFNGATPQEFVYKLNNIMTRYTEAVCNMNWSMLDSHDAYRFYTQCNENKNLALIATAIQMFFKGIPCIYYGDEIPLVGGYDPDCRRCFNWDCETFETTYFKTFRSIVQVRHNPIVKYGKLSIRCVNGLIYFTREYKGEVIELVINYNHKKYKISCDNVICANQGSDGVIADGEFIIYRK